MQPNYGLHDTRTYCERLAESFKQGFSDRVRTMGEQESLLSKVNEATANLLATLPQAQSDSNAPTSRRQVCMRIPLKQRPNENPTNEQIIQWSLREGIAQRLYPGLNFGVPSTFTPAMLQKFRIIYASSLARWYEKNNLN